MMYNTRFQFGNIVVVEENLIGVIVKSWLSMKTNIFSHEVYVRSFNSVKEYPENQIRLFAYDKELTDEDMEYQEELAIGRPTEE